MIDNMSMLPGAIFGMLTVVFGAFGAHGLEALLIANDKLNVWDTAVQYLSIHAISLLTLAAIEPHIKNKRSLFWVRWSWIMGTVIFSGSLFALALSNISILGAITPIGGLALILGWILLILTCFQKKT